MLGLAYFKGEYIQKNDYLSLAWFRESIKNGRIESYLNAGDLLYEGGNNLEQNKIFALANYLQAFKFGARFLARRIQETVEEIERQEGKGFLPEIVLPDV